MTTVLDLAGFFGFLALLAWAGLRRAATARQFLVADRSVTLFPLVATLVMTEFNPSTLLAFSAAGYTAGPMALALPLVFLVGLSFYTLTVAREWKRFNRLSVAELFATRYSPALGRFAATMLLLAMTGFCATYVKSLALLFLPLMPGMSEPVISALMTLVVLAVVLPGGLLSVVRSDVVSFIATLIVLPLVLFVGIQQSNVHGGLAAVFSADQRFVHPVAQWSDPALPFWFVSTLIVLTCFTYIAAPWYGQKIFAARDERTAFAAVAWSSVLVFALYGVAVLAAAHYRVVSPGLADPQTAVPLMMWQWLPSGVRGVGQAVLFAAALTTLGGVWTAMAAMTVTDFRSSAQPLLEPESQIATARTGAVNAQRLVLVAFAVLSWLGAVLLVDDILNRLILANIPVAALSFALLAGFHWPRATTAGAWASVVVGVLWGVGSFLVVGESGGYTWPWAMYGVPLIFLTGIGVSLATSPREAR
jgi:solute:Na+ symporter, SSS family